MPGATSIRAWWLALSPQNRDWALNVAWGLAIAAFVAMLQQGGFSWVEAVKNAPLDRMMRSSAALAMPDTVVPPLVFIDIDDATWRSPSWGGGEPYRAPRDALFGLVDQAFRQGARQVVLDVLVEGRGADDDATLVSGLRALMQQPHFDASRHLVLVRSIRRALEPDAPDELRDSPLDPVVAESGGRIAVAAPYFRYSTDYVLRDWQLLEIACVGAPERKARRWQVIPAVQLAVAAHHANAKLMPALAAASSQPAADGCTEASAKATKTERAKAASDPKSITLNDAWERTRQSFAAAGIDVGAKLPPVDSLGNRIVFRLADPPKLNQAQVIPANEVLDGRSSRYPMRDAIVVIGQSYPEAGDRHQTPLGEMAGALVILNGIDSMIRHHVIRAPSPWFTVPLSIALIVFVGFVFAYWDSTLGPLIATTVATILLFAGSYQMFKHGVWMDFELPMLGIQVRKTVTTIIDAIKVRRLNRRRESETPV